MSRDSPQDLPPELRERAEQDAEDHTPDIEALWTLLESAKPSADALPDASETWGPIRRHIDAESTAPSTDDQAARTRDRRGPRRPSTSSTAWPWGVALAAVLLVGLGAWYWSRPVVVTAPPGDPITRTLPDGSIVELHGGTRLAYSRSMATLSWLQAEQRTIRLEGEAYFEVDPANRPFVVSTETARVEAVGTAFSVQHWATDDADTHVALASGTVRVRGTSASSRVVTLTPGQAIRVTARGPDASPVDTTIQRITAWRRGGFAVTAQPLPQIARALERRFGTPIGLSEALSDRARNAPLTLYYAQDITLETVLHDVCMARGLSYRAAQTGYVLEPKTTSSAPSGSSQ